MRKIIVGDIHGCLNEFKSLLEACEFRLGTDQLYLVGDLINKGPDSKGVIDLALRLNAKAVIGNHEYHLIRDAQGMDVKRSWVAKFKEDWAEDFAPLIETLQSWPYYIEEEEFTLVHAGLVPGEAPADSDPFLLTNIRTWDGEGKRLWNHDDPAWFELYEEEKLVVFGHWAALEGVNRANAIGLDSGCVYGKKLTALILPERRLVSVPAQNCYCPLD